MSPSARLALVAVLIAGPLLQGCVAATVAGAAVGVGATAVGTGAKVAGAAVGVTADAAGAVVHTATGGGKKNR